MLEIADSDLSKRLASVEEWRAPWTVKEFTIQDLAFVFLFVFITKQIKYANVT